MAVGSEAAKAKSDTESAAEGKESACGLCNQSGQTAGRFGSQSLA